MVTMQPDDVSRHHQLLLLVVPPPPNLLHKLQGVLDKGTDPLDLISRVVLDLKRYFRHKSEHTKDRLENVSFSFYLKCHLLTVMQIIQTVGILGHCRLGPLLEVVLPKLLHKEVEYDIELGH